jgi:hypothetical protein
MGKELACEGLPGTARVVWTTHTPMDSKVWVSLTSGGPYTLVASSSAGVQGHDLSFYILGIGATHYFYVESTSADCGTLQSAEGLFCVGSEIIFDVLGLSMTAELITSTPVTLEVIETGFASNVSESADTESEGGFTTSTVLTTSTPTALTETEDGFATDLSASTIQPT